MRRCDQAAQNRRPARFNRGFIEGLESRTLLSAVMHPGIIVSKAGDQSNDVVGDTPAQILKAYGIDQISFGNSTTSDGAGQTIAIVDPYNDPSVGPDLKIFDNQFGISAPPSLTVVDQDGGQNLPQTNGSWAGEIATDVEWAHAVAPGAKLLLVETDSDNTSDLMAGVSYAIKQPNVSVISLSWGGSEFSTQTGYDSQFNTPDGHEGVTVLAAAGDNGAVDGAQWPASAPNVVSVGGSVLHLADNSGTYGSETSWTDTSGGISRFEKEPFFQQGVDASGMRSMPDVAINADDNIGQALYDSVPFEGIVGWQTTNGTSVGTPEWAGLVAIANQGRALNGQATLDGPSQTLPLLYSLYGAPGTSAYTNYATYFNDITIPENAQQATGVPTVGYDATTGLGSPQSAAIVSALVSAPSAADLAAKFQTQSSQISVTLTRQPPASVVSGTAGSVHLRLTNAGSSTFAGSMVITLDASTDVSLLSDPTQIGMMTVSNLHIARHGSHAVNVSFTYPSFATQGDYYLVATAASPSSSAAPAEAASQNTVSIAPAFVKLSPAFTGSTPLAIKPGKNASPALLIRNAGNVTATGTLSITLYDSADNMLDASDTILATTKPRKLNLHAGKNLILHIPFPAPGDQQAGYFLIATITASATTDTGTAVIGTR